MSSGHGYAVGKSKGIGFWLDPVYALLGLRGKTEFLPDKQAVARPSGNVNLGQMAIFIAGSRIFPVVGSLSLVECPSSLGIGLYFSIDLILGNASILFIRRTQDGWSSF